MKLFVPIFSCGRPAQVAAFLPPPEVPKLEIETAQRSDEELLTRVVEQVYRIKRDDENLRQIVHQPSDKRGRFFDDLRKHYPVRREFQNTLVSLDQPRESLARKLAGIGFRCDCRWRIADGGLKQAGSG